MRNEKDKEKVLRGWHEHFAWTPVRLDTDSSWKWLQTVERQFYAVIPNRKVAKKGLREEMLLDAQHLHDVRVAYRPVGSNFEKRVYQNPKTGCFWVDPKEASRAVVHRYGSDDGEETEIQKLHGSAPQPDPWDVGGFDSRQLPPTQHRVLISFKKRRRGFRGRRREDWEYVTTTAPSLIDFLENCQKSDEQFVLLFATEIDSSSHPIS